MKWGYISLGLLLLLCSSFLDNSRGPLLPVFSNEFSLSHTSTSGFLIAGSMGGLLGTFLLIFLSRNFTEKTVLKGLIAFSMAVNLYSFAVNGYFSLLALGFGMGAAISTLGAMANVVTMQGASPEKRGQALSILHTVYGFGSFLAPNLVAATLVSRFSWKSPFVILGAALLIVLTVANLTLPSKLSGEIPVPQKASLNKFQLFIVIMFSIYVAGEVMVSMWLVTYLVEISSLTVTEGSNLLGQLFLVMMITRVVTFFCIRPHLEKLFLYASLVLPIFFLIVGMNGHLWAFPLVGLFGPYFPILLARVTKASDKQSKTLTMWIIAVNSLFIMISHQVVGRLADAFGLRIAFIIPCLFLGLALLLLFPYFKWEKRSA